MLRSTGGFFIFAVRLLLLVVLGSFVWASSKQ